MAYCQELARAQDGEVRARYVCRVVSKELELSSKPEGKHTRHELRCEQTTVMISLIINY